MHHILDRLNNVIYKVYLNNIFIYVKNYNQLIINVNKVLECLRQYRLYTNKKQSKFISKVLNILRQILTKEGLPADLQKIDEIINWPRLETRVQMQQFMGMVNYCSQFLLDLCRIAELILRLIGKTQEFH